MPHPSRGRVDPGDLARQVARHLADTGPGQSRLSFRDSVLAARLTSGVIVLAGLFVLVLLVFGGVSWLLDSPSGESAPEVLFDPESYFSGTSSTLESTPMEDDVIVLGLTAATPAVPLAPTVPAKTGLLPVLPSPTTTQPVSITAPVTTSSSVATTSTTPGSTSSSSTPTSTSSSTTSTTSTVPTTTTTAAATTTSSSTTTTTSSTTSTTTTTTTVPSTTTTTEPTPPTT